jgi:oligopeptide transport system substrate-binding protein
MVGRHRWRFAAALTALAFACLASAADPGKVLHIATFDIDTLDPHQYSDDPSFQVVQAIFEPLYEWDYLADPPTLTPLTAAGQPEITDDGRTWTIKLRPGILFTDHPAFKGKPRELLAADYVYSYKRWLDPNGRRGGSIMTDLIEGARAVVDQAKSAGRVDFDRPIAGLRALDRYTLQIRLTEPNYPNIQDLLGFVAAAAREVVEAEVDNVRARPVGTGPFMLREWKRGSRIVLDANPSYRPIRFPATTNARYASLARQMAGRTLPQIGVIEMAVIEEDSTRVLQFEQGGLDYVLLRGDAANRLLAGDAVRPEYANRGMRRVTTVEPFLISTYFHMSDPVVGGLESPQVALRRAIALAVDKATLVKVVYGGQAMPADQLVPPEVGGHDPVATPATAFDPAAARALLDRFGYRTGPDRYRTLPDGRPLTLRLSLRSGDISREIQTLFKRNMDAIGVRMAFNAAPFQDIIKELQQGQWQMYFGAFGGSPSGYAELSQLHSKQSPRLNVTGYALPEYDRAMDVFMRHGDATTQIAAARTMNEIARRHAPLVPVAFRISNLFVQPWLEGFAPMRFSSYWKYLDIDVERRRRAGAQR